MIMIVWTPYYTLHIKQYPVFKPNDYFFEHHWDSTKEEKWEAFARVVRNVIREGFDFKLSDLIMEDKLEYKKLLKKKNWTYNFSSSLLIFIYFSALDFNITPSFLFY